MGVIIFTDDDTKYRKGDYICMYGEMTVSPTVENTTFIYHAKKFTEADAILWAQVIPYRMVVVMDKLPKLTSASEHCVIVDQQTQVSNDYSRAIRAVLCWSDRERAHKALTDVPLPLAGAFLKANIHDIGVGRLLARCRYTLHDDYMRAVIAYGVEPVRDFKWPPKTKRSDYILPSDVRQSDKHIGIIINNDIVVSNDIRRHNPDELPVGLPKKQQKVIEWI
jgi:hypothetical protein